MVRFPTGRLAAAVVLGLAAAACDESPVRPSDPVPTSAALRIDSVTPSVGSTVNPTTVVIQGSGFDAGATVSVGGVVLSPFEAAPTSLVVSVPQQPPAVLRVTVTNPDGRSVWLDDGFRFEAEAPIDPNLLRVTGQLLAGGSGLPFAGASMRLVQDVDPMRPPVMTDDDGKFVLAGIVPPEVDEVLILIERAGMLWGAKAPWTLTVPRSMTSDVILRIPDLLLIRGGSSIRGTIASGPGQLACTFESVPCVPLVVDGPPGASIELELVPDHGQAQGLVAEEGFLAPTTLPTRLFVLPGSIWVMGEFGSFTVKAHSVLGTRR